MSLKVFAKNTAIIGGAQIVIGLASFLLLPIITKSLGPYDYGVWIQITVTIALVLPLVLLNLQIALIRFISAKADKVAIRQDFFAILYFTLILGAVAAVVVAALAAPIAVGFYHDGNLTGSVVLTGILIPFAAYSSLTNSYFMARGEFKTYAVLSVLISFGQLILSIGFLSSGMGLEGVVLAFIITYLVVSSIALVRIIQQIGYCAPKFRLLQPYLTFSMPLIPNSVVGWIVESSDRYLVAFILGLSFAGVYSAAYGLASIIFLIVIPINNVLYPTVSKLYDNDQIEDVKQHLSQSLRFFLLLTIPAFVGLTILAEPLLTALTTPDFASGSSVIPLVALAGVFLGAFMIVMNILHLVKRTKLTLITFLVPAAMNVVLVFALTPVLGITGAALSTTIAYLAMLIIGTAICFRFLQFPANWPFIAKCAISSLLMAGALLLLLPTTIYQIAISIGVGILVYFASMIILGGVTRDEVRLVWMTVHRMGQRLRYGAEGVDEHN